MTTSGTVSFNLVANEFIEKAFHRLGKASEGEALTARMYEDGRSSLNLLLKALGAEEHLWTKTEGTLSLVSEQEGYSLTSPRPLKILSVRRRTGNIDTPLQELSRQEYFELPTKTTSYSIPTSYYYDPQQGEGTLYVWPSPSTQATVDFTLALTYLRRIEDITSTNDDIDIPQEWQQGLIWALADDLETEYPVNDSRLAMKIERKAAEFMAQARRSDTEPASVYLQPDYAGMRW